MSTCNYRHVGISVNLVLVIVWVIGIFQACSPNSYGQSVIILFHQLCPPELQEIYFRFLDDCSYRPIYIYDTKKPYKAFV